MIELATIAGSKVEIMGQHKINKQGQILTVAVELNGRISVSYHQPSHQILGIKEVTRLMNPHLSDTFSEIILEAIVKLTSEITLSKVLTNQLQIMLTSFIHLSVLNLAASSEAPKFGLGSIPDLTVAILVNTNHGQALISSRACCARWEIEDQGLIVELVVTFGKLEHGSID
jgi:hypothetical protein